MCTKYPEIFAALPEEDEPEEVFREITDHPGYRVSSRGRVQSDIIPGSKSRRRCGTWRDIKPYKHNTCKYLYVDLRSGRRRNARIHVLVLEAFVGPRPEGEECCHVDGDRTNNRLENLRWGTRSENMQDAVRHGTIKRGSRQENAKLSEEDIPTIRTLLASGLGRQTVADIFGVCYSVILEIEKGQSWRHVP